jgi:hypothetical protein
MALRLPLYVLMVWQVLVRTGRLTPNGLLPPVLPVILYNGKDKWKAPRSLRSLIDLPPGHPMLKWQPQGQYIMIDENSYGRGERKAAQSLAASLFGFDTAPTAEVAKEHLRRALDLTRDAPPGLIETVYLFLYGCGATERLGLRADLKEAEAGVNTNDGRSGSRDSAERGQRNEA